MDTNPWQTHGSELKYENDWITLTEHQVTNSGGGDGIYGTVHFKNYALGVVPVDEELNTWLVGQWRYPLGVYSWEIPMGGGRIAADKLTSAQRELKEETGITAAQWQEVCVSHLSNSVSDEVAFGYLARDLTFGETDFDESEDLQIKKLPLKEALHMCHSGQITDSLSMITLMTVGRVLGV